MKESHSDPKRLGEHPEMQRLGSHPEAQRLGEHPAPGSLPVHEDETPAAAPIVGEVPATSDAQETKGIFRGAGWVALAVLAIMVAASLIWRPKFNDSHPPLAVASDTRVAGYSGYDVTEIDGVVEIDSIVELVSTVGKNTGKASAKAAATALAYGRDAVAAAPSAVVVYLFNTDKSDVPETASLTAAANRAAKTGKTVVIKAYTDETGNAAYNRRLSERRARAIGDYMVAHGVPASHIKAKGYGPTHAYANNAQDRRAEITLE